MKRSRACCSCCWPTERWYGRSISSPAVWLRSSRPRCRSGWPLLERFLIRGERLTPGRIAGLIVGFCGVAAVVAPAIVKPSTGAGLILGTLGMQFYALAWNLGTLRAKYRPSGVPAAVAPALQMLLGGLVTLRAAAIAGPWHRSYVTMRSGLALAYLTMFGSGAYHFR